MEMLIKVWSCYNQWRLHVHVFTRLLNDQKKPKQKRITNQNVSAFDFDLIFEYRKIWRGVSAHYKVMKYWPVDEKHLMSS